MLNWLAVASATQSVYSLNQLFASVKAKWYRLRYELYPIEDPLNELKDDELCDCRYNKLSSLLKEEMKQEEQSSQLFYYAATTALFAYSSYRLATANDINALDTACGCLATAMLAWNGSSSTVKMNQSLF